MKCSNISENGSKCFRPKLENSEFCQVHTKVELNDPCPICLEKDGNMYPLSCLHRIHLECMEGFTKLQCPICRAKLLNIPDELRKKIEKNGEVYKEEVCEEERRELLEYLERENSITQRLPPNVELLLALKYVAELGVPVCLIPSDVTIEIDVDSPLPEPGSIFQNAVKKILELIQNHVIEINEDDECDSCYELTLSEEESLEDFNFEGDDIHITRRIRTTHFPDNDGEIALRIPAMHTTISFNFEDLDDSFFSSDF